MAQIEPEELEYLLALTPAQALATIAHTLKHPANAIQGWIELLKNREYEHDQNKAIIEQIQNQVARIQQVLAAAQIYVSTHENSGE